jgi:hypothetical protein
LITKKVLDIHQKINFSEAPLYLPEIVSAYPDLELNPRSEPSLFVQSPIHFSAQGDKAEISFLKGSETRPYMRYLIAKTMGLFFLGQERRQLDDLREYEPFMIDLENNIFASKLLAPANLLRTEMSKLNVAKDVISQLADVFWVSKSFMNRRVQDLLQNPSDL